MGARRNGKLVERNWRVEKKKVVVGFRAPEDSRDETQAAPVNNRSSLPN